MKKSRIIYSAAFISLGFLLTMGCSTVPVNDGHYQRAYHDSSPQAFKKLGINPEWTGIWEDGMRTDGQAGSYEWWYTDAEFEDGTIIVAAFITKNGFDVSGPAQPTVTLDITFADGSVLSKRYSEKQGTQIMASKDQADVTIGDNFLRYEKGNYQLYVKQDNVEYSVTMKPLLPMWRPGTGYMYFGDSGDKYFAWFVAQPSSEITGTLTIDGKTTELSGTGYHDHNWGNVAMNEVINHWYWGRAKIGKYNIIIADIISEKNTGYTRLPVFMLAAEGKIIEGDSSKTKITRSDTFIHPKTHKFFDNHLTFVQQGEDGTIYTIELVRQKDILVTSLLNTLPPFQHFMAQLAGFNPTYIRTLGEVTLKIQKQGEEKTYTQTGLWEQMFFGSNKQAYIWN